MTKVTDKLWYQEGGKHSNPRAQAILDDPTYPRPVNVRTNNALGVEQVVLRHRGRTLLGHLRNTAPLDFEES